MRIGSSGEGPNSEKTFTMDFKFLKSSRCMDVCLIILLVLTGGLFYLPYHWFITVKTWFYLKSNEEESTHVMVTREDFPSEICEIQNFKVYENAMDIEKNQEKRIYRVMRNHFELFYYSIEFNSFVPLIFNTNLYFTQFHDVKNGIESKRLIKHRKMMYREAVIDVPVPSWFSLYFTEILKPFFVFQIFSVILWCTNEYYWYAICIFVIMCITLTVNAYYQKKNLENISRIANNKCKVKVIRNGEENLIDSNDLVPGDIIVVGDELDLPCDCILLDGFVLVDEAMLTGESQPVLKEALPQITSKYTKEKLYTLSAGTKVVKSGSSISKNPTAIVISTGYNTAKGELIRSILFPKPNRFKFERDALIFVALLFLMAMIGFFTSIPPMIDGQYTGGDIVKKLLDLITIAVPPALPLTMSIGIGYSLRRLQNNKITCISQPAINASGRVSVICFDKTGTLTTDTMKLKGAYDVEQKKQIEDVSQLSIEIRTCLSTCHSLTLLKGELVGDPQEIALVEAIGWKRELLDNGRVVVYNPETRNQAVSKFTYHFNPEIKRMGVVIEENGKNYLLMKGAPEVIIPLCTDIPNGMFDVFMHYTREGYRVLACAIKELDTFNENDKLEDIEKGLKLIGFPYLENPIKKETPETIKTLRKAKIYCVISTGDNMRTALAVGRTLELVTSQTVFLGELFGSDIVWEDHEGKRIVELPNSSDYELIISGSVLEKILTEANQYEFLIRDRCKVYGRMAPSHKIMLVKFFQTGETMVAMVGDGANDCGALKQADVGLSLSDAEASIAAPFSSKSLLSIIYILREGRCALATSFQYFKFMMLYSVIQFVDTVMLYWLQTNLTNNQFIYQDFFNVMPCVFTVAASLPYYKLSKKMPPGSLMSVPIITSVLGVTILAVGINISAYLLMNPCFSWYSEGENGEDFDAYDINDPGYIGDTVEDIDGDMVKSSIAGPLATVYGNVIFLQGTCQIVMICTIFSIGKPFREPIYKNKPYVISVLIVIAFNIYFLFDRTDFPYYFIDLWDDHHMDYRWMMFGIFWAGTIITYLYEKFMVPLLTKCIHRMMRKRTSNY